MNTSRRDATTQFALLALAAGLGGGSTITAAQQNPGAGKTLVAYFSRTGNTRVIARHVRRLLSAELFEIEPADPYPDDYDATVRQALRETESGYEPALKQSVQDIASYDVVFLGFPIWGSTAPPAIRSFLSKHDLSRKTIVPLITHGGYGRGRSQEILARHAPRSRLSEAFVMQAPQERQTVARVQQWLNRADVRQLR